MWLSVIAFVLQFVKWSVKWGMSSGLTLIVIVIVIGCHFMPLFFIKSGTLIFGFFCIILSNVDTPCLRHAFVVPSLFTTS